MEIQSTNVQAWFSVLLEPQLTNKELDELRCLAPNYNTVIWDFVWGRRLTRVCTSLENLDKIIEYVDERGLQSIIVDVRYQNGVRYWFKEIVEKDEEWNIISSEIIEDTSIDESGEVYNLIPFPINETEYNKYFLPYSVTTEEGEELIITPPSNQASWWVGWNDRK